MDHFPFFYNEKIYLLFSGAKEKRTCYNKLVFSAGDLSRAEGTETGGKNLTLGFCSFASSSSGNCYLVKSESTNLLVDVGISAAQISRDLKELGIEDKEIAGVFLTHEHTDHIKSVAAYHKLAPQARFIASAGTVNALKEKVVSQMASCFTLVKEGTDLSIGDIRVRYFRLSHDAAEPIAYTFEKDGKKISIVTDTGCVTEEIQQAIRGSDILVLEANHEENILLYGKYPYPIKRRILSDKGHLSNEAAGRCLCRLLRETGGRKVPKIFLAHLSRENNTPQQAYLTVRNLLEEEDFFLDRDFKMEVIAPAEEAKLTVI